MSSFAQDKSSRDDMLEEIKHDEGLICSQEESGVVESVVAVSPAQPVRETVDAQFVQITADNDVVSSIVNASVSNYFQIEILMLTNSVNYKCSPFFAFSSTDQLPFITMLTSFVKAIANGPSSLALNIIQLF